MKLGIAARLAWWLALVGGLASALTGFYAFDASRELLVRAAKDRLLVSTQSVARRIVTARESISRDLLVLAGHPTALAVLQRPEAALQDQMATLFSRIMLATPGYFQIRLIAADGFGREVVRLDRDGTGLTPVLGDELQEKGHFSYVSEALKVEAGQTYMSRFFINHEEGSHDSLGQPTVYLSMPVADGAGRVWGVVVVTADLRGLFKTMITNLPSDYQLFFANTEGDILIHPDPTKAFGFDRGQRVLLQDLMPASLAVVQGLVPQTVAELTTGEFAANPLVVAFSGGDVQVASDETHLVLGMALPLNTVMVEAETLGATVLKIVLGLSVGGLLLTVVLARALTRPINEVNRAALRFAQGEATPGLPVERQDEIGALARSFQQMQTQISQQMAELESSRLELAHLALHDNLTGLPNRRLFIDRLEAALTHARRYHRGVSLMFVDLDKFKDINDRWGHEAGDAVLKQAAVQLQAMTRESDTVARLGGDEFVLLLGDAISDDSLALLATKLIEGLQRPVVFNGQPLHVGASIGVSRFPQDGNTTEQLMSAADGAMYRVKAGGRNGFLFACDGVQPASTPSTS